MDPLTLGTIGMAASAGSGAVGVAGALYGGAAKAAQYKYQAGVAKVNAQIARQNAEYALHAGEVQASQSGRKTAQLMGRQIVGKAAGNIDVASGNVQQVVDSQHQVGMEDQGIIRENAGRRAYGQLTEAAVQDANAKMYGKAAGMAKTASYIDAASSFMSSASSVSSKWLQGSQMGLWGGNPTVLGDATYYEETRHSSGYSV